MLSFTHHHIMSNLYDFLPCNSLNLTVKVWTCNMNNIKTVSHKSMTLKMAAIVASYE